MLRTLLLSLLLLLPAAPALARPDAAAVSAALADLADRAVPAVVLVQVDRRRPLSPELQELLRDLGLPRAWHTVRGGEASGSGVIVSPEGRVITNAHVVAGAVAVTLVLSDQRRVPARVVAVDARTDVAVLQIESDGPWPWVPLGRSDAVRVGEVVLAVGNPFEFQSSVTLGVVSATGRRGLDEGEIQDYLQTDAAVNPGSSGGPLLALDGTVVGINTAIFAPDVDQNAGISFAIPADLVRRVVGELDASGRVRRTWVGLVTRTVVEVDGDPTQRGAEVLRVIPDSPAARAGLRRGDIVVAVDGEPTPSEQALRTLVLVREVGSPLVFEISRDGQPVEVALTTTEERRRGLESTEVPAEALYWQGATLASPSDDLRARFGVAGGRGLLVVRVDEGSPAEVLGLAAGDLVVEVGGEPVTSVGSLDERLGGGPGVWVLGLQRAGSRAYTVLPAPP